MELLDVLVFVFLNLNTHIEFICINFHCYEEKSLKNLNVSKKDTKVNSSFVFLRLDYKL